MTLFIEGLVPVAGKKTLIVRVAGRDFEIAAATAEALALAVGHTLDPEQLAAIEAAAARRAAAAQALRYLRGRPRTEAEVSLHLAHKGYARATVEGVLESLRQEGVVDDGRFAEWFVRGRLSHRPSGARRLLGDLRRRGIPDALARDAVSSVMQGPAELELALRAARKRLPLLRRLDRERALRRLSQFLVGRGFSDETVRRVCLEELGPSDLDGDAGGSDRP